MSFLIYAKTKRIGMEAIDDAAFATWAEMEDNFSSVQVRMGVRAATLEILGVDASLARCWGEGCQETLPMLKRAAGLKLGPGLTGRITEMFAGVRGCWLLMQLLLDCAYEAAGVPGARFRFGVQAGRLTREQFYRRWFDQEGHRYRNTCIAFADNSPLMLRVMQTEIPAGVDGRPSLETEFGAVGVPSWSSVPRLIFSGVERTCHNILAIHTLLEDLGQGMSVDMEVEMPELRVKSIEGRMRRHPNEECPGAIPQLQAVVGTIIERGARRGIASSVAGPSGCVRLASLVQESYHSAIQAALAAQLMDEAGSKAPNLEVARRRWLRETAALDESCLALGRAGTKV